MPWMRPRRILRILLVVKSDSMHMLHLLPFSSFYNYSKKKKKLNIHSSMRNDRNIIFIKIFMAKHAINAKYYICGLIIDL